MSPTVPYLTTRPQSANLWFRRGVPQRLRPHLGRREIFLSLETPDKREAGRRCILTAAVVQKMFDAADKKIQLQASRRASCTNDSVVHQDALEPLTRLRDYFVDDELFVEPLQSWMIPTLLTRYEEASLAGYEEQLECMLPPRPNSLTQPGEREKYRKIRTRIFELERQNYAEQIAQLRDAILDEDTDIIENNASAHLYGEKLSELTTDKNVLQQYKLQLMTTELEVLKKIQSRLHGEGTPIPDCQTPHASEHDNWDSFLKRWQKIRTPRPKSISETWKIAEEWKHFTDDMPTAAITKKDVRRWANHMRDVDQLAPRTVKRKVALLRAVVNVAIDEELTALQTNPFAEVSTPVPEASQGKETRQPFETRHLQAFFSTPVYTSGERPGKGGRDAAFWIPLLALTTGARLEEIGQLRTDDVFCRNDRLWLRFTNLAEGQEIKNATSFREIPAHKELLRVGFAQYVERTRSQGEMSLFPHLKPNKYGQLTATFSTWCNEYIDDHVTVDSRYVVHSFRHNFEDFGVQSDVQQNVLNAITGHAQIGMAAVYGRKRGKRRVFSNNVMIDAMDKMQFEGVDLSHLYIP